MGKGRANEAFSNAVGQHGISRHYKSNVIVDIDGVIVDFNNCPHKCDYSGYPETAGTLKRMHCPIMKDAIKYLLKIRKLGLNIVLYTSRVESERAVTEKHLKKCGVPYDELRMDKPMGFILVDDMCHSFTSWRRAYRAVTSRMKIAQRGKNHGGERKVD